MDSDGFPWRLRQDVCQEDNPAEFKPKSALRLKAEMDDTLSDEEKEERKAQVKQLEKQHAQTVIFQKTLRNVAIISTGVVMNILFAIICAAGAAIINARNFGENRLRCAGSPAWGRPSPDESSRLTITRSRFFHPF